MFCAVSPASAATSVPFIVNTSEPVTVTTTGGTPRLQLDVGGATRYATYTSGSGSAALTFTYTTQPGDLDLNGITVSSPLQLNGGTITDSGANALSPLTFTVPSTSGVLVDHPSLSMNFLGSDYILNGTHYGTLSSFLGAAGGSFSRSGTATYFDSSGTLQTAATDVPRFDYNPATLGAKGLLMESASTNYIQNSQFSGINTGGPYTGAISLGTGGHWQVLAAGAFPTATVTVTQTGTLNGIPFVELRFQGTNSTGAQSFITFNTVAADRISVSTGDVLSASGWMAITSLTSTGGAANVRFSTRSYNSGGSWFAETSSILSAVTPWTYYRVPLLTIAAGAVTADAWIFVTVPNGTTIDITARFGGMQLERGRLATSYIPTTNGTATRNADNLTMPAGSWYSASEGTFMTQSILNSLGNNNWAPIVSFDDGSINNFMTMFINDNGADQKISQMLTGGVNQFQSNGSANIAGTVFRQSMAYAANDAIAAADGVLGAADTTVTLPPVTSLRIGHERGPGTQRYNGTLQSFRYYPRRVANADVTALSQ